MEAEGVPAEMIEAARSQFEAANLFEVWPENWPAVQFFAGLSTQWRSNAAGHLTGLDYAGMEAAARMQAIPRHKWRNLFFSVQVMETAALAVFKSKQGNS